MNNQRKGKTNEDIDVNIDKKEFDKIALDAINNPTDRSKQDKISIKLYQLAALVCHHKKLKKDDDMIQSAVMKCWSKLPNSQRKKGSPFSWCWITLWRAMLDHISKEDTVKKYHEYRNDMEERY